MMTPPVIRTPGIRVRPFDEESVTFQGFSATIHGTVTRPPEGAPARALVLAHGRNGGGDEPMIETLAKRAAVIGLWTLRFDFGFVETGAEPSAGHEDEIADLREAVAFARRTTGLDKVTIAGRGLGAWAAVACATDEDTEDLILLGLSYTGQEERRMALERLAEFEVPTLIIVGSASDRLDLPALRELVARMPFIELEVLEGADHRLRDSEEHPMVAAVLARCETWLRARTG